MIMMMVMMTMGGMVGHIKSRNRAKSRRNDLGVSPFPPRHDDLEIKFFFFVVCSKHNLNSTTGNL